MIKTKHNKNTPHFNKQRIDLWQLKKDVENQAKADAYLLRRIDQLENLFDVLDEEVMDLRNNVMTQKTPCWGRLFGWFK
ncbi:hypothetical protein A4G18_07340 [Pasteurellaceae bacterium Pebbles2]|nr:hypothetical protein [Pasteurellaceae bacterium Pebbles2]